MEELCYAAITGKHSKFISSLHVLMGRLVQQVARKLSGAVSNQKVMKLKVISNPKLPLLPHL